MPTKSIFFGKRPTFSEHEELALRVAEIAKKNQEVSGYLEDLKNQKYEQTKEQNKLQKLLEKIQEAQVAFDTFREQTLQRFNKLNYLTFVQEIEPAISAQIERFGGVTERFEAIFAQAQLKEDSIDEFTEKCKKEIEELAHKVGEEALLHLQEIKKTHQSTLELASQALTSFRKTDEELARQTVRLHEERDASLQEIDDLLQETILTAKSAFESANTRLKECQEVRSAAAELFNQAKLVHEKSQGELALQTNLFHTEQEQTLQNLEGLRMEVASCAQLTLDAASNRLSECHTVSKTAAELLTQAQESLLKTEVELSLQSSRFQDEHKQALSAMEILSQSTLATVTSTEADGQAKLDECLRLRDSAAFLVKQAEATFHKTDIEFIRQTEQFQQDREKVLSAISALSQEATTAARAAIEGSTEKVQECQAIHDQATKLLTQAQSGLQSIKEELALRTTEFHEEREAALAGMGTLRLETESTARTNLDQVTERLRECESLQDSLSALITQVNETVRKSQEDITLQSKKFHEEREQALLAMGNLRLEADSTARTTMDALAENLRECRSIRDNSTSLVSQARSTYQKIEEELTIQTGKLHEEREQVLLSMGNLRLEAFAAARNAVESSSENLRESQSLREDIAALLGQAQNALLATEEELAHQKYGLQQEREQAVLAMENLRLSTESASAKVLTEATKQQRDCETLREETATLLTKVETSFQATEATVTAKAKEFLASRDQALEKITTLQEATISSSKATLADVVAKQEECQSLRDGVVALVAKAKESSQHIEDVVVDFSQKIEEKKAQALEALGKLQVETNRVVETAVAKTTENQEKCETLRDEVASLLSQANTACQENESLSVKHSQAFEDSREKALVSMEKLQSSTESTATAALASVKETQQKCEMLQEETATLLTKAETSVQATEATVTAKAKEFLASRNQALGEITTLQETSTSLIETALTDVVAKQGECQILHDGVVTLVAKAKESSQHIEDVVVDFSQKIEEKKAQALEALGKLQVETKGVVETAVAKTTENQEKCETLRDEVASLLSQANTACQENEFLIVKYSQAFEDSREKALVSMEKLQSSTESTATAALASVKETQQKCEMLQEETATLREETQTVLQNTESLAAAETAKLQTACEQNILAIEKLRESSEASIEVSLAGAKEKHKETQVFRNETEGFLKQSEVILQKAEAELARQNQIFVEDREQNLQAIARLKEETENAATVALEGATEKLNACEELHANSASLVTEAQQVLQELANELYGKMSAFEDVQTQRMEQFESNARQNAATISDQLQVAREILETIQEISQDVKMGYAENDYLKATARKLNERSFGAIWKRLVWVFLGAKSIDS